MKASINPTTFASSANRPSLTPVGPSKRTTRSAVDHSIQSIAIAAPENAAPSISAALSNGTCGPCECTIGELIVPEGDHNEDNDCEFCSPGENSNGWTVEPDGASCGPTLSDECCAGTCQPTCEQSGCIIGGVQYDDFERNPDVFCEACNEAFPTEWSPRFHPDCPPPCLIDGVLHPYGTVNLANDCEDCSGGPAWSASGAIFCGDADDQNCCNGICCLAGECCTVDRVCGTENCDPEGCSIGGGRFPDGTDNPNNPCESCDVDVSKTSWTPNGPRSCGPNLNQSCCNGSCCDLGVCCSLDGTFCDPDLCSNCAIDGEVYVSGEFNPQNNCEVCNVAVSRMSWTNIC